MQKNIAIPGAEVIGSAMHNLVAPGMAYVETATFPAEINNISSALNGLSLTYHLNIRNVPRSEGYQVVQLSDKSRLQT